MVSPVHSVLGRICLSLQQDLLCQQLCQSSVPGGFDPPRFYFAWLFSCKGNFSDLGPTPFAASLSAMYYPHQEDFTEKTVGTAAFSQMTNESKMF